MRLKASWVAFLLVWAVSVAWGYFRYVPQTGTATIFRKVYRSNAVIYIRPSAWKPFGELYVQRSLSPIDIWFVDTAMIAHLVERRELGKRAAAKLKGGPAVRPEVMAASLLVTPVSTKERFNSMFLTRIGEENTQIDSSGQIVKRVQRISFLRIQAFGSDPADAQRKAQAFLEVFQEVLGELATEDLERRTKQLKDLLASTEKKLNQSKLAWREKEKYRQLTDESRLIHLQREAVELRARVRLQQHRADNLQGVLNQGSTIFLRNSGLLAASDRTMQELQRNLHLAKLTYQPDSERVTALQDQVNAFKDLRRYAQKLDAGSQMEQETRQLRAAQALLGENQAEQARLLARRPPEATLISRAKRSAQIDTWDRQILDWKKQLFQLRLLLRLGKADGSSEVIQSPRPGVAASRYGGTWQQRYKGFLAWLPVATFIAFMAAWLGAIYDRSCEVAWRVEKYLDLEILESLPVLSGKDRLAWTSVSRERV